MVNPVFLFWNYFSSTRSLEKKKSSKIDWVQSNLKIQMISRFGRREANTKITWFTLDGMVLIILQILDSGILKFKFERASSLWRFQKEPYSKILLLDGRIKAEIE